MLKRPRHFLWKDQVAHSLERRGFDGTMSSPPRGFGMIDIAIWAIVVPLGAIAYIVWNRLKITRAQHKSTMAALSSLGDTHRRGYVALTLAVQRLEKRLKELEGRR
jgi:hypothetical protein